VTLTPLVWLVVTYGKESFNWYFIEAKTGECATGDSGVAGDNQRIGVHRTNVKKHGVDQLPVVGLRGDRAGVEIATQNGLGLGDGLRSQG